MDKYEILNRVIDSSWFKNVDTVKIAKLLDLSFVKKYAPGEYLYMVGDIQDNVFFVLEGQVKVSIVGQGGEEFMLTVWEANNWLGEAAFHGDHSMPLEVSATREVKVLLMPVKAIESLLDNGDAFYKNIMLDMVGRAKLLYRLVDALLFKPLNARVAVRMLHLLKVYGEQGEDGMLLPLKFSQAEFARMSGGSRQRVNKVFRQWSEAGIVTKQGRNYVVHNVAALEMQIDDIE